MNVELRMLNVELSAKPIVNYECWIRNSISPN